MIDYRIIDLEKYPRKAHLEYFMSMQYPQLTITVPVDVTDLKAFCKRENCSFFLTFLHVAALSADRVPQLRQRIHRLSPEELQQPKHAGAYKVGPLAGIEIREYVQSPTSHTESTGDELYCYCCLNHHMPWEEYIRTAAKLQQEAREKGSLEEDEEIEAFYFPTSLPWINFSAIVHPSTDRYDSNPRICWGKFEEDCRGRLMMPLTLEVHHGLVDGIHLAKFYENVKENMAALIEGRLEYNLQAKN